MTSPFNFKVSLNAKCQSKIQHSTSKINFYPEHISQFSGSSREHAIAFC